MKAKLIALRNLSQNTALRAGAASAAALAAVSAHAADGGDYGAGAAITATQATVLGIIGGFITMGIAVWGASYILRRFFPKGK